MQADREIKELLSKYKVVDMYGKSIKAVSADLIPIIGRLVDYVYESDREEVEEFIVHDTTTDNCYYFSREGMRKMGSEEEKRKVREALLG